MISSLPGKALRTLVDIARLAERFKPSLIEIDIIRCKPGILFISLPTDSPFKTIDYDVIFDFCVDSASLATKNATSSCPDRGTCGEINNVYQATCNNALYMRGN